MAALGQPRGAEPPWKFDVLWCFVDSWFWVGGCDACHLLLRVDVECVGAGDGLGGLLLVVVHHIGAGDGLGKCDGFRLERDQARERSRGAGD